MLLAAAARGCRRGVRLLELTSPRLMATGVWRLQAENEKNGTRRFVKLRVMLRGERRQLVGSVANSRLYSAG